MGAAVVVGAAVVGGGGAVVTGAGTVVLGGTVIFARICELQIFEGNQLPSGHRRVQRSRYPLSSNIHGGNQAGLGPRWRSNTGTAELEETRARVRARMTAMNFMAFAEWQRSSQTWLEMDRVSAAGEASMKY